MKNIIKFGDWEVYSQHPDVSPPHEKIYAENNYLPKLVAAWQAIEQGTGYRWKCTSYWRMSPSHSTGAALDIAPDIAPSSEKFYAVNNGSDPVLYKREEMIRDLQRVAADFPIHPDYLVGVFIEPDHLHIQLLQSEEGAGGMRIVKWKVPKPVYGDTESRMRLPMIRTK